MTDPAKQPNPAVSVVMPTYQRPRMLERAIASVIGQTWSDWELLVVDDNGVDSPEQQTTAAFMARFDADPRIRYLVHRENRGACAARNTGIHAAHGRFVAFLDDDDVWYPVKLERQLQRFEDASADVALVYGGFRQVDARGRGRLVVVDGTAHEWRNLLQRNGIGTTSLVLCRRDALLAVGGFDERLAAMQDFDLYIRLAQRFPFAWVDEPLLDKHHHAGATIGKNLEGILEANAVFFEKHRHLFEHDREVHHRRLRWYGHQALRAGRSAQARGLLRRAWLQRPADLGSLALSLLANSVSLAVFQRTQRWVRRRRRVAVAHESEASTVSSAKGT